jgi:hypothetical protein
MNGDYVWSRSIRNGGEVERIWGRRIRQKL